MRARSDRKLTEPYRSWIDRAVPLPDGVRILFPLPANPIPRHVLQGVASVFGEFFVHFGVYIVGAIVLFGIGMTISLIRYWVGMAVRDAPWQIYAIMLIGAGAAGIHFWTLRRHRHKSPSLELTRDALRIEFLMHEPAPAKWFRKSYARASIYEVKFVEHSGNLVIRARGHEMLELCLTANRDLHREAAEILRNALSLQ